ncbi:hypothetical protein [Tateyamaria sp.]|uniref:hypothetical protein n=1 Tax=Tateyamaria sp. TaxID=1929288 RepID=UPI00329C95B2
MAEVDFSDVGMAKAWFEGQPPEVRSTMASRAALRVGANLGLYEGKYADTLVLTALRCTLTSAVRGLGRTADVEWLEQAARSADITTYAVTLSAARFSLNSGTNAAALSASLAARSALSAARSADSAASSVSSAARSGGTSAAGSAAHSALIAARPAISPISSARSVVRSADSAAAGDSQHLDGNLNSVRLWAGTIPPAIIQAQHTRFLVQLRSNPDWDFFRTWYEQMWDGMFTDWDLATAVAKINDDVWGKGLAAVAEEIRGIKARLAHDAARINETLVLNNETQKYSAEHIHISNTQRLDRHLSRVEESLDDILALGGGNGLTTNSPEFRIIKRLVGKYSDDPERVAFDLTDVNKSIRRQTKVGEYADDEPLKLLQAANTACVAFICDAEPEIAKELGRDFDPRPQAVPEQDVLVLEEAWRISEAMLEPNAALTTLEDKAEVLAGQVIDAEFDPMPEWSSQAHAMRSIVLRRQISRMWQQAQGLMTVKGLAELYDTDHSKAAGYVGRMGGGAATLITAILILAGILGLS